MEELISVYEGIHRKFIQHPPINFDSLVHYLKNSLIYIYLDDYLEEFITEFQGIPFEFDKHHLIYLNLLELNQNYS
jgi:hypothetical protein